MRAHISYLLLSEFLYGLTILGLSMTVLRESLTFRSVIAQTPVPGIRFLEELNDAET